MEPKSHEILMFVCLQKDAKQCCNTATHDSIVEAHEYDQAFIVLLSQDVTDLMLLKLSHD